MRFKESLLEDETDLGPTTEIVREMPTTTSAPRTEQLVGTQRDQRPQTDIRLKESLLEDEADLGPTTEIMCIRDMTNRLMGYGN